MMTYRKRDENEPAIVTALEAIGAVVTRLNDFGVPDLLVGYRGKTTMIEVKNPDPMVNTRHTARSKAGKRAKGTDGPSENAKGQLTPTQVKWWSAWTGGAAYVVETPEQAVALVKGVELPGYVRVEGGADGVRVTYEDDTAPAMDVHHHWDPDEADALAGALHEQAGVARARAKEHKP